MKTLLLITLLLAGCGDYGYQYAVPGPQGNAGKDGTNGTNGNDGHDGAPGTPGTVITHVQLCASCVAHYPDVLPEVAECADGKLYGVYSALGGYEFNLITGFYTSNAIGCGCTVYVSGCTVTP